MNDLIKIDESGKTTARELYDFLNLATSQFSRWAKTNIEQNEFYSEGIDWWGFDIVSSGNETKDFSLTIDFAKHLCMLSRSERGKQARNYFVEVEKRHKNQQLPATLEDLIIMQAQSVKDLKEKVNTIELDVKRLQQAQSKKAELVEVLPVVNEKTIRASINQIVRGWAGRNNTPCSDAFNILYREFYYRYSINLKDRAKNRNTTPLDVAEENGSLKELLSLAVNLFA